MTDANLDQIKLFKDFQEERPDLVGENLKGAYHLIQRRRENGLEPAGALIKRRGHWFVNITRFTKWFLEAG